MTSREDFPMTSRDFPTRSESREDDAGHPLLVGLPDGPTTLNGGVEGMTEQVCLPVFPDVLGREVRSGSHADPLADPPQRVTNNRADRRARTAGKNAVRPIWSRTKR